MAPASSTHVDETSLGGKLLIATPAIGDPRFDRSVILICDHTPEGAMGIIINKPADGLQLPELFEQLEVEGSLPVPDRAVLAGGPVDKDRGFVLHTRDYARDETTLPVTDRIGLTATKDILEAMISASPPQRSLLALGYSGWGAGQLEDELVANAWLVCDMDEHLVFDTDATDKWPRALELLGISPQHLSALSGHA
ncbi:YqgE/AlgH family protein [Maricaulis sp.]|uniref:YqgE/AlgH family protein n=1 Tax=Maricaulis sp. TaxID=1486257 RepID=UPI002B27023C|nr:YqgE/AlgH family protein [Maricaulis sp.]